MTRRKEAPPDPEPAPMDSAVNRSKPALGIFCPNPKCRARICGRFPSPKGAGKAGAAKFVAYTRYRPGRIQRVRVCPNCGQRCLTSEGIISNATHPPEL